MVLFIFSCAALVVPEVLTSHPYFDSSTFTAQAEAEDKPYQIRPQLINSKGDAGVLRFGIAFEFSSVLPWLSFRTGVNPTLNSFLSR